MERSEMRLSEELRKLLYNLLRGERVLYPSLAMPPAPFSQSALERTESELGCTLHRDVVALLATFGEVAAAIAMTEDNRAQFDLPPRHVVIGGSEGYLLLAPSNGGERVIEYCLDDGSVQRMTLLQYLRKQAGRLTEFGDFELRDPPDDFRIVRAYD